MDGAARAIRLDSVRAIARSRKVREQQARLTVQARIIARDAAHRSATQTHQTLAAMEVARIDSELHFYNGLTRTELLTLQDIERHQERLGRLTENVVTADREAGVAQVTLEDASATLASAQTHFRICANSRRKWSAIEERLRSTRRRQQDEADELAALEEHESRSRPSSTVTPEHRR